MQGLHTEGVIYSRQRYFKLFSDFFDLQSSLLSVLQSQSDSRLFAFDHLPQDPCAYNQVIILVLAK